jgi:hypothetical protein
MFLNIGITRETPMPHGNAAWGGHVVDKKTHEAQKTKNLEKGREYLPIITWEQQTKD